MKKVKKAIFTMAALVALAGMALTTGCEKKQGGTGGSTGGFTGTSSTGATGGGTARYSSSR